MTALRFVDTNVLIYAHDRDAGVKHDKAKRVLTDLWNQENGCLSVQVLQEFFVNVTKKNPASVTNRRGSRSHTNLSALGQNRG